MNKKAVEEIVKNEMQESNTLEFKHIQALINVLSRKEGEITELTKDVSAMANSNGGTIVYGIQEYSKGNKKGKAKSITTMEKGTVSLEWLEQILNSRIQPRLESCSIKEVDINEEESVVVIELGQSSTVHQANDKRYYKRYEFQAVAMDDWEVKSLINRFNKPVLEENIYVKKRPDYAIKAFNHLRDYSYDLIIGVSNTGNIMAKYLHCFLRIEKQAIRFMDYDKLSKMAYKNHFDIEANNKVVRSIPINNRDVEIGADYEPILPNSWRHLIVIPVSEKFFKERIELRFFMSSESTFMEKSFVSTELEVVD